MGTLKFGHDPKTSVLDVNCKAHDLDNLYVSRRKFFCVIRCIQSIIDYHGQRVACGKTPSANAVKTIALVILALAIANQSAAQERFVIGGGLTYCSYQRTPGINLNATCRVIRQLHVGPDFSVLLTRRDDDRGLQVKRKELEYNLNATYLFPVAAIVDVYPLVGLNVSKITVHPEGVGPDKNWVKALNIGAGLEVKKKSIRYFGELKYVSTLSKFDLTIGILKPL